MSGFWVIEPHHDDAVYSLGGMLQSWALSGKVRLVTVFSESEVFNPRFTAVGERGLVRKKESLRVADELGVEWYPLGLEDEELSEAEVEEAGLYRRLAELVRDLINDEEIIFLPAGFGGNPHHLVVERLRERFVNHILYEDTAPVPSYSRVMDAFMPMYDRLFQEYAPHYLDISPFINRKTDLASIYESQFSGVSCRSLKAHARNVALFARHTDYCDNSLGYAERIYLPRDRARFLLKSLVGPKEPSISRVVPLAPAEGTQFRRKTSRNLFGSRIGFRELSELLQRGAAETGSFRYLGTDYPRLAYPTAGGLGNSQIFVLAFNVSGLAPGVYRYDPHGSALAWHSELPGRVEFTAMIEDQEWGLGASCAAIIHSRGKELHRKYGARAVQLALVEAGHVCQNLLLSAESLGMNAVEIGGFSKQEIRARLGIDHPTAVLLFSGVNREVREPGLESLLFDDLPERPAFDVGDGNPTAAGGPGEPGPAQPAIDTRSCQAGALGLWISRTRVPLKDHFATGAELFFSDEGAAARERSRVKSEAEAEEIFSSFASVPQSLVYTTADALRPTGRVVRADRIRLDFIQRKKRLQGLADPRFDPARECHYLGGLDLLDGGRLWCPADAVLISKRFWDQLIWPSSTGYGCAASLAAALSHSVAELVEKILVPDYLALREIRDTESPGGNLQPLLRELRRELPDVRVFSSALHPFSYMLLRSEARGIFGSAVGPKLGDALNGAAAELLAKFFEGSNENLPVLDGGDYKDRTHMSVRELLKIHGLSIGYTHFPSALRPEHFIAKAFVYETQ